MVTASRPAHRARAPGRRRTRLALALVVGAAPGCVVGTPVDDAHVDRDAWRPDDAQPVDEAALGDPALGDAGLDADPGHDAIAEASLDVVHAPDAHRDAAVDRDARADVTERDTAVPTRPSLGAFWDAAGPIAPNAWYLARTYVRPSTHTATPIHGVAVYFAPTSPATHSLIVSGDRPCGAGYCTTPQWVAGLHALPIFAVNGDYFTGVDYGTGAGTANTVHLWRTGAGLLDPGDGTGSELSCTGPRVAPTIDFVGMLPDGTQDAVGGVRLSDGITDDPSVPDFFAARTVSGVDDRGYLYVLVAEGFDHPGGASGNGLTRHDAWEAMTAMGASVVVNHDGGGSSQLFVRGRGLVYPASNPRYVANHFAVQD